MLPLADDPGRIDNAFAQVLRSTKGMGTGEMKYLHGAGVPSMERTKNRWKKLMEKTEGKCRYESSHGLR